MGKYSFGGCMQGLQRANSTALLGWVEGSITHLKSGRRQVIFENGQIVCFIVGEDDIVIRKEDVTSFKSVKQGLKENALDRPLDTYDFDVVRFLHIEGVRKP